MTRQRELDLSPFVLELFSTSFLNSELVVLHGVDMMFTSCSGECVAATLTVSRLPTRTARGHSHFHVSVPPVTCISQRLPTKLSLTCSWISRSFRKDTGLVAKKLPVGRKIIKTIWLIAVNYTDASYFLQKSNL